MEVTREQIERWLDAAKHELSVAQAHRFKPAASTVDTVRELEALLAAATGAQVLPQARPLTDELMDCVDRLGSEKDTVDPRVWEHLLVYAPKPATGAQAEPARYECPDCHMGGCIVGQCAIGCLPSTPGKVRPAETD